MPNDVEGHRRTAIETGERPHLLGPILCVPNIANPDRSPPDIGNDQVIESARVDDPSHRPQDQLPRACIDIPPRHIGVLPNQRVADLGDRDAIGRQTVGVDPHVDRPQQTAVDLDLTDSH